jgi:hypothetical protein
VGRAVCAESSLKFCVFWPIRIRVFVDVGNGLSHPLGLSDGAGFGMVAVIGPER